VDASWNGLRAASRRKTAPNAQAGLVRADARVLPFGNGTFEGVYCFGLLHEFTGERKAEDVMGVMGEIRRLLCEGGLLVLAVLAGRPEAGLPAVQLFTRQMFTQATRGWRPLEIKRVDDVGCTNTTNYRVWYGLFEK
jgi:ubiquinone/menaquinone biosynthesis C-methylase UbiE